MDRIRNFFNRDEPPSFTDDVVVARNIRDGSDEGVSEQASKCHNFARQGELEKLESWLVYCCMRPIDCTKQLKQIAHWTLLHTASEAGHAAVVAWLVDDDLPQKINGGHIPVNAATGQGWTAAHVAAAHGHKDALEVLLQAGADFQATDENGATPLHGAAECGHLGLIKLLASHGCHLDSVTKSGATAAYLAKNKGRDSVVALLGELGADVNLVPPEGPWVCPACTFDNQDADISCAVCKHYRIDKFNGLKQIAASVTASWVCGICTFINPSGCSDCQACGTDMSTSINSNSILLNNNIEHSDEFGEFMNQLFASLDLSPAEEMKIQEGVMHMSDSGNFPDDPKKLSQILCEFLPIDKRDKFSDELEKFNKSEDSRAAPSVASAIESNVVESSKSIDKSEDSESTPPMASAIESNVVIAKKENSVAAAAKREKAKAVPLKSNNPTTEAAFLQRSDEMSQLSSTSKPEELGSTTAVQLEDEIEGENKAKMSAESVSPFLSDNISSSVEDDEKNIVYFQMTVPSAATPGDYLEASVVHEGQEFTFSVIVPPLAVPGETELKVPVPIPKNDSNNCASPPATSADPGVSKNLLGATEWECEVCTYHNPNTSIDCQMCGTSRNHLVKSNTYQHARREVASEDYPGNFYFVNDESGVAQWEPPAEMTNSPSETARFSPSKHSSDYEKNEIITPTTVPAPQSISFVTPEMVLEMKQEMFTLNSQGKVREAGALRKKIKEIEGRIANQPASSVSATVPATTVTVRSDNSTPINSLTSQEIPNQRDYVIPTGKEENGAGPPMIPSLLASASLPSIILPDSRQTILSRIDFVAIQNVVEMKSDLINVIQNEHAKNTKQEQMKSILNGEEVKREYFIQFLVKIKSFFTACEAAHSGLVDEADFTLGDEMSKFAIEVSQSGGMKKAASSIRWMRSIAEVISVIKQQFQAVPFLNGACSLIEFLLKQQDENTQKLKMFRGAMFSTLCAILYDNVDSFFQTVCLNLVKCKHFDEYGVDNDPIGIFMNIVQSKVPGFTHLNTLASKLVGEKMSIGESMALAHITVITNGIFDGTISCELSEQSLEQQITGTILGSEVFNVLSEFKSLKTDEIDLGEKALSHLGFDSGSLLADSEAGEELTREALKQALVDVGAGSKAAGMSLKLRKQLNERFNWSIKPAADEEVQMLKQYTKRQQQQIEELIEKANVIQETQRAEEQENKKYLKTTITPAKEQDVKRLNRELVALKSKLKGILPEESAGTGGGLQQATLSATSFDKNYSSNFLHLQKEVGDVQLQLAMLSTTMVEVQTVLGHETGQKLDDVNRSDDDIDESILKARERCAKHRLKPSN